MARTVLAAGTLPWRIRKGRLEVLVVHRPRYNDWAWAKGKLEKDETLAACAVRETWEETGDAVRLGQYLGEVSYALPGGGRKECHYWAALPLAPDSPALLARQASSLASPKEIDAVRWVEVEEARALLSYERDHAPLDRLVELWDNGELETWTIAVVRHGKAVKRAEWKKGKGGEDDRPLAPRGQDQAEALVELLAAYGIEDVLCSPWERCAATMRPYLEVTQIGAEMRPELTEAAHRDAPKAVRRIVDHCVRGGDVPVALCTHRPVLPTVLERLASFAPKRVARRIPASDPWLSPGHVLIVHVSGGGGTDGESGGNGENKESRVVGVEEHDPLDRPHSAHS